MIKKLTEFVIFGSIFIALCAVGLCMETSFLLHLPLNNLGFYTFIFGSTLAQYNLHYLIKKTALSGSIRFIWSSKNKKYHKALFIFGCILIFLSLFSFHITHFFALGCMSAISLLYTLPILPFKNKKRIKDFGLLKIITLALLWTLVTVWFPLVEAHFETISFTLIFIRRFIFIFILCLVFDIRDMQIDGSSKIKTLPIILGVKVSLLICYLMLLLFVIITSVDYYFFNDSVQFYCMILSALITWIFILFYNKKRNDFYYLAGIDGMMLLQSVIVIAGETLFAQLLGK